MSRSYALEHWLPRELVARCGRHSLNGFLEDYADAYFLLVRLWDRYDNLTAGLMSRTVGLRERDVTAGSFTTAEYSTTMAMLRAGGSIPPPESSGAASEAQNDLCFLMPLRVPGPQDHRITVGRSRQRHILLQHRSVSQLHAWFEYDASGDLYVTDAESKNRTTVNGERLGNEPFLVTPGAQLRFGAVRATICSPAAVWAVLAGESNEAVQVESV